MSDAKQTDPLPVLRAVLEVARILAEMIRAEPLYAIPGFANGRSRLFPEAFGADIDAARARLGLPPAQPRSDTADISSPVISATVRVRSITSGPARLGGNSPTPSPPRSGTAKPPPPVRTARVSPLNVTGMPSPPPGARAAD